MKIAIDITQIVYGTGVSTYTRNLVTELLRVDTTNDYVLFGGYLRRKAELVKFLNSLDGNFKPILFPIPPLAQNILWNYLHLTKIETFVGEIDIFHSSDWAQPSSAAKSVTTVHDLVPLLFPELSTPRLVMTHKKRLARVRSEVNKIIVPSKATKADLVNIGFTESRIAVIPEASDPIFKPADESEVMSTRRKFRLGEKYLISIGLTPRKNIKNLLSAYEVVKTHVKYPLKLVLIGKPFMKLDNPRGVSILGHVSRDDLQKLYSGAEALVYPSLYEGFGLPIVEAFACKTPVVTSNFGSMKEVAADAAYQVDPNNVDDIVKGILAVLGNKDKYARMGLRRNKLYSWPNIAKQTLKLYNSIIG